MRNLRLGEYYHKDISTTQQTYFVDIEDMNQLKFNVSDDLVKEVQTT